MPPSADAAASPGLVAALFGNYTRSFPALGREVHAFLEELCK